MMESGYLLASARVFLILLGLLLIYLGWKGVLEPMVIVILSLSKDLFSVHSGEQILHYVQDDRAK